LTADVYAISRQLNCHQSLPQQWFLVGLKQKLSPNKPQTIAVAKAIRTQELKHDPSRYAKNQIG
jgi:hypothetical protein